MKRPITWDIGSHGNWDSDLKEYLRLELKNGEELICRGVDRLEEPLRFGRLSPDQIDTLPAKSKFAA